MEQKKQIPEKVLEAAKWYIDNYGYGVEYLATDEGKEYYCIDAHGAVIGYPTVFIYANGEVEELGDDVALDIICNLADKGLIPGEEPEEDENN